MLASVTTRVASWKLAAKDEAVGRERRLGDAEWERTADGKLACGHQHALILGVS
jgi:hypothetical protein